MIDDKPNTFIYLFNKSARMNFYENQYTPFKQVLTKRIMIEQKITIQYTLLIAVAFTLLNILITFSILEYRKENDLVRNELEKSLLLWKLERIREQQNALFSNVEKLIDDKILEFHVERKQRNEKRYRKIRKFNATQNK